MLEPMPIVVEWWVARIVMSSRRASVLPRGVVRAIVKAEPFAQLSDGSVVELERAFASEQAARDYITWRVYGMSDARLAVPSDFLVAFYTDATV